MVQIMGIFTHLKVLSFLQIERPCFLKKLAFFGFLQDLRDLIQ